VCRLGTQCKGGKPGSKQLANWEKRDMIGFKRKGEAERKGERGGMLEETDDCEEKG